MQFKSPTSEEEVIPEVLNNPQLTIELLTEVIERTYRLGFAAAESGAQYERGLHVAIGRALSDLAEAA